jgi:deoxyribonuclease V
MIACFDVHYENDFAIAAAVVIENRRDEKPVSQYTVRCEDVEDYQAGSFYQRELKPLQKVLQEIESAIDVFVIDAYCHLSDQKAPGLGAYFHELLPKEAIVIGVAKNRFRDTTHAVELYRGESQRPQFVTSIGVEYLVAAERIREMGGKHRVPTILKAVDRLCRDSV